MIITLVITVIVGILAYWGYDSLFPEKTSGHTRNALQRVIDETHITPDDDGGASILREDVDGSAVMRFIAGFPGGESLTSLMLKAGFGLKPGKIVIAFVVLFFVLVILGSMAPLLRGIPAILVALLASLFLIIKYLQGCVQKRNDQFINMFPDVLDMIVRSVRSGFPLHTAMKLVADNMDAPISTEFQQVTDEISLGRPLNQALSRLAERIPEQDIRFFVVVLNVQQETGGNLAEVISNLSMIIRKRKQLRMKIRAMTSEARATGWVLGSLPIIITVALQVIAPNHLVPLYTTSEGYIVTAMAIGLIVTAFIVIRRLIQVDI